MLPSTHSVFKLLFELQASHNNIIKQILLTPQNRGSEKSGIKS